MRKQDQSNYTKKFCKTHAELIRTIFTGISTIVQTIALLHLFGLV